MKKIFLSALLGTLGLVAACATVPGGVPQGETSAKPVQEVVAQAAKAQAPQVEAQAYALTAELLKTRAKNSNFVFSPYCFQAILPLVSDNTRQASTRKELAPYLVTGIRTEKLRNTKTGELILLNKQLARDYTGSMDGNVKLVEYPAEALAEKQAFQKRVLDSVIDSAAPEGDLNFLTAAHYFAEWEKKFDKQATKPRKFTNEAGKVEQVPTMYQHFAAGHGASTANFDIAEIYGKKGSVVYFIKPKTAEYAQPEKLATIINAYEKGKDIRFKNINLWVPKISIKNKLDLKDLLKNNMKINSFFTGLTFDRLTKKVPYVLATASQTATLDINEEYAEGKALTEFGFRATAVMAPEVVHDIAIDSPYYIVIKDTSDFNLYRIVFTAFIADPK